MKSKPNKYIWVTAAALLLIATALLYAQTRSQRGGWGPGMGRGMMGHGFLGHIAQQLQLTDAQKTQIKTLWDAEKPTMLPLVQQLAEAHKQMLAITANGAFDQDKVAAIANRQTQTLARLMVEKEKLQSQIYNQVLTPEQRAKADQLRQTHAARMDRWLQNLASAPAE
jgi:Spy/CpxP family protein refolding chaperone